MDDQTYICNDTMGALPLDPETEAIFAENGMLCQKLDEPYIPQYASTQARCGKDEFEVAGGFFVMGDNRGFTTDSLCCFGLGCYKGANYIVPQNYLIGKVFLRLWPTFAKF